MAVVLVLETGAGIPTANIYETTVNWRTWATNKGYNFDKFDDNDIIGAAMIRSCEWQDYTYRKSWSGVRTYGPSGQGLIWPRKAGIYVNGVFVATGPLVTVTDAEGNAIPINVVPKEVKLAANEGAWREMQTPGSLAPDLERGGALKRLKAGPVELEYFGNASAITTFTAIDGILQALIVSNQSSPYTAMAVRA